MAPTPSVRAALLGDYPSRQEVSRLFVAAVQPILLSDSGSDTDSEPLSLDEDDMPCLDAACMSLSVLLTDCPITRLRKECPDVLRACAGWLMDGPMGEEREDMAALTFSNLPPCHCDMDNPIARELHDHAPTDPVLKKLRRVAMGPHMDRSPLRALLRCFVALMRDAFLDVLSSGLHRTLKRARPAKLRGVEAPWPSCTLDMTPQSLDVSLYFLCAWQEWCDLASLLELLRAIHFVCASPAFPSALLSTIIPLAWTPAVVQALSQWNNGPRHARAGEQCMKLMLEAGQLSQAVRSLSPRQLAELVRRDNTKNWEKTIAIACTASKVILDIIAQSRGDTDTYLDCARAFQGFAFAMHHAIGSPNGEQYPAAFLRNSADCARLAPDPVGEFVLFASFLYHGKLCANPDCELDYLETEEELRVCAGCAHTFYCSKACQKAAWRSPKAPHREICATLRNVTGALQPPKLDVGGYLENEREFAQQCRDANVEVHLPLLLDYFAVVYSR